ncbi:transposase, partial [Brochothrix campestris]
LPAIENSFKYEDSNGHLGGINNKIKVIKRISFGYRNFSNFRNRILLGFNHKRIAPNS